MCRHSTRGLAGELTSRATKLDECLQPTDHGMKTTKDHQLIPSFYPSKAIFGESVSKIPSESTASAHFLISPGPGEIDSSMGIEDKS